MQKRRKRIQQALTSCSPSSSCRIRSAPSVVRQPSHFRRCDQKQRSQCLAHRRSVGQPTHRKDPHGSYHQRVAAPAQSLGHTELPDCGAYAGGSHGRVRSFGRCIWQAKLRSMLITHSQEKPAFSLTRRLGPRDTNFLVCTGSPFPGVGTQLHAALSAGGFLPLCQPAYSGRWTVSWCRTLRDAFQRSGARGSFMAMDGGRCLCLDVSILSASFLGARPVGSSLVPE